MLRQANIALKKNPMEKILGVLSTFLHTQQVEQHTFCILNKFSMLLNERGGAWQQL